MFLINCRHTLLFRGQGDVLQHWQRISQVHKLKTNRAVPSQPHRHVCSSESPTSHPERTQPPLERQPAPLTSGINVSKELEKAEDSMGWETVAWKTPDRSIEQNGYGSHAELLKHEEHLSLLPPITSTVLIFFLEFRKLKLFSKLCLRI